MSMLWTWSSSPTRPWRWTIAVLREPDSRGGSAFVHERLDPGTTVHARGPRNNCALPAEEPAEHHVFPRWRSRTNWSNATASVFRSAQKTRLALLDLEGPAEHPEAETMVHCCGSQSLLAAIESHCAVWPSGSLHTERFSARVLADTGTDMSFEADLAASGTTLVVPPSRSSARGRLRCGPLPDTGDEARGSGCDDDLGVLLAWIGQGDLLVLTDQSRVADVNVDGLRAAADSHESGDRRQDHIRSVVSVSGHPGTGRHQDSDKSEIRTTLLAAEYHRDRRTVGHRRLAEQTVRLVTQFHSSALSLRVRWSVPEVRGSAGSAVGEWLCHPRPGPSAADL